MTSSDSLQINVAGEIWWGGFTADLTIRNSSDQALEGWSTSFVSPHQLNPDAWGVSVEAETLDNGLTRYTLTGLGWGSRIPAGGEVRVGFNGSQGTDLGQGGVLTADMLMSNTVVTPMPAGDTETSMQTSETSEQTMDHGGMDHSGMDHGSHQHGMDHSTGSGDYTDITTWGTFHGSNHNSEHNELVGGRTAITTEALEAYNGLRAFAGLQAVDIDAVGNWAFANGLTNNSQAWGNDIQGVGLWYAMQGAKVGWIADQAYNPQILADIQRTARLGSEDDVMDMVRQFGHQGVADHIEQSGLQNAFINTLKMEPHYGGWMHGRTHGFLDIEGVAIAHDINHLTVLGWDQSQPFMNDTFDWPQWPALDVSDQTVINYYQGIVALGDPLGQNLENLSAAPQQQPAAAASTAVDEVAAMTDSQAMDYGSMDHDSMDHGGMDHGSHQHGMDHSTGSGDYTDITTWGTFHGSNHNSEHNELVGGRTAITTEALEAYNGLRAFAGLQAVDIDAVGNWAFANGLTNNSQAWGNDIQGVGLWYAMQGAKVGWIADQAYNPQILADIQRTARLGSEDDVMDMVRQFGHQGVADHIEQSGLQNAFINTLKMEPHYGGWMHGRTHGFLDIEGVAIAHDINHLTVLGWDQSQPFMNDTFDWPQWPALDVSDQTVINYYQGIVALGDPLGQNLENLSAAPQLPPDSGSQQMVSAAATAETDPLMGIPLEVEVGGDLWWGGLTALLTVTNRSDQLINNWDLSFTSPHRFDGSAWGIDVATEPLDGGLYRYELSGSDWGQSLDSGQSLTVGFNALAGTDLEREGALTEAMLLASGSDITALTQ